MTTTTSKTPIRKHTRKTEEKRTDALDEGIRMRFDGEVYSITAGDLTALDSRALRQQAGITFPKLLEQAAEDFDLDTLACLIWLARRVNGERTLTFDEVAASVGYDDLETLDFNAAEDPDQGDAPGE